MKKSLLKAVNAATQRFYGYRKVTMTFEDPEDLHQMRVAGRTLLSYLYALTGPGEKEKKAFLNVRKPLKKALFMLGNLRDADVLIEEVEQRLPQLAPAHREIIGEWLKQKQIDQDMLRARLTADLPKFINKKWKKAWMPGQTIMFQSWQKKGKWPNG